MILLPLSSDSITLSSPALAFGAEILRRLNLMPQTDLPLEKQPFHQSLLEYFDFLRHLVPDHQRILLQEQKVVNLNPYQLLYHACISQRHHDVSILRIFVI